MSRCLALGLGLIALGTAGSVAASAAHSTASQPCPKGTVTAVIGGKNACLKTGRRCNSVLDRQYHTFGFHCHDGRLTRNGKPTGLFARKVNVGGHRLFIQCRGKGSPTVVLESGGGWNSAAWSSIEPGLARTTRVCSYDRAGLGNSDARVSPELVSAATVVEELHTLLQGAGISPPYVLGGWSLGSFWIRLYTKRYPGDVVGLVSVDGTPIGLPGEPFLAALPPPPPTETPPPPPPPGLPDAYDYPAAAAELAAAPDLGARPLVVLIAGARGGPPELEAAALEATKQIALLSTSSIVVRADGAGHAIQLEAPDLTAEAFRVVIAAVRAKKPLPACSTTRLPELFGACLDPSSP